MISNPAAHKLPADLIFHVTCAILPEERKMMKTNNSLL